MQAVSRKSCIACLNTKRIDQIPIYRTKNGCKPYHRNAPIALKFAPTQKCYQNFRLLTKHGFYAKINA